MCSFFSVWYFWYCWLVASRIWIIFSDFVRSVKIPITVDYKLSPQFELVAFVIEVWIKPNLYSCDKNAICVEVGIKPIICWSAFQEEDTISRASQTFTVACLEHQVTARWSREEVNVVSTMISKIIDSHLDHIATLLTLLTLLSSHCSGVAWGKSELLNWGRGAQIN